MGIKDLNIYIEQEGVNGTKKAFMTAAEDPIKEIKEEILKRAHFCMPKKKHLLRSERNKIKLSKGGQEFTDEEATVKQVDIKAGDCLAYTLTAPLED